MYILHNLPVGSTCTRVQTKGVEDIEKQPYSVEMTMMFILNGGLGNTRTDVVYSRRTSPVFGVLTVHLLSSRPWTSKTAVGKSAILLQFTERQFRDAHDMTIGVEFGAKDVSIGDAQVCMGVGVGVRKQRERDLHIYFHYLMSVP